MSEPDLGYMIVGGVLLLGIIFFASLGYVAILSLPDEDPDDPFIKELEAKIGGKKRDRA